MTDQNRRETSPTGDIVKRLTDLADHFQIKENYEPADVIYQGLDLIEAQARELVEARAERDAAVTDAKRYRYVRDPDDGTEFCVQRYGEEMVTGETLDAEIDRAIVEFPPALAAAGEGET